MTDLTWRHTWPDAGPDFVLFRAREGEPETIGRVRTDLRSAFAYIGSGWSWSLTSQARPVGIPHPGHPTSGFDETQRGARDALVAAWRQEAAFQASVVASEAFAGLGAYMQDLLVNGQPVPPERVALPDKLEPARSAAPEGRRQPSVCIYHPPNR